MQPVGRKRRISTCLPCYTRKQKCNRRYPCNHCTRRRRPEECVFGLPPASRGHAYTDGLASADRTRRRPLDTDEGVGGAETAAFHPTPSDLGSGDLPGASRRMATQTRSALAQSFGYSEHSSSNTMALLRNTLSSSQSDASSGAPGSSLSPAVLQQIQQEYERMPPREVLDFLVQYHVHELNWMKQVIHGPAFLTRYQKHWARDEPLSVPDVEFVVLILRICAYAAQFLPSPTNSVDTIRGLSLSEIRKTCTDVGDSLAGICLLLDANGSLVRVQHLLYISLQASCEGRTDRFWDEISSACRAALKAGIHTDAAIPAHYGALELEKEMNRRTFCGLYVLDSHLARQLDCVPTLPNDLVAEALPRMRLSTEADPSAPELFTERLMQVRLGQFWRQHAPERKAMYYDPTQAEQRYERFVRDYLSQLPPALALEEADTKWDGQLPKLAMQRQLLRIAVFDSVCWNFRPLLLLTGEQVAGLPAYKQVLLRSQKKRMCLAALQEFEAVTTLHGLFGGSHTRFAAIIFNTFEAVVLLLALCTHPDCPFEQDPPDSSDLLGLLRVARLTRDAMIQAAETALDRLQMLAEVSKMAASGVQIVSQLLSRARAPDALAGGGGGSSGGSSGGGDEALPLASGAPWPPASLMHPTAGYADVTGIWMTPDGSPEDSVMGAGSTGEGPFVPDDFTPYLRLQLLGSGFPLP